MSESPVPAEIIEAAKASILEEPPDHAAFDRLVALCAEHNVPLLTATNAAVKQLVAAGVLVRGPQ